MVRSSQIRLVLIVGTLLYLLGHTEGQTCRDNYTELAGTLINTSDNQYRLSLAFFPTERAPPTFVKVIYIMMKTSLMKPALQMKHSTSPMRHGSGVRELSTSSSHWEFISSLPCYLGIQLTLEVVLSSWHYLLNVPMHKCQLWKLWPKGWEIYIHWFTAMNKKVTTPRCCHDDINLPLSRTRAH